MEVLDIDGWNYVDSYDGVDFYADEYADHYLVVKELDEDEFANAFSNHLINDRLGEGPYKGIKKITAKVITHFLEATDKLLDLADGSLDESDDEEGDKDE